MDLRYGGMSDGSDTMEHNNMDSLDYNNTHSLSTAATASSSKKNSGAITSSSFHKVGHVLTCLSCVLFILLIQLVDCRHHDLNNVIKPLVFHIMHPLHLSHALSVAIVSSTQRGRSSRALATEWAMSVPLALQCHSSAE